MAFRVCRRETFPLLQNYSGPTAVVQFSFNFAFIPGISACDQLNAAVRAAMFGTNIIPLIRTNYLSYVLEEDTDPFIDAYRVTITLAGETDGAQGTIQRPFSYSRSPGALIIGSSLVALVLAVGAVLLIFGPIGYRIFNGGLVGDDNGGLFPGIDGTTIALLGAGALGLALVLGGVFSGKR